MTEKITAEDRTECIQCGTCCTSGGPALHSDDLIMVRDGRLPKAQLITIRKGELAHNPLTNSLQRIKNELVKISGVGREWNCYYFDPMEKGCTIYEKRPKACRSLKCWDTAEIEQLIEKDTVSRLDLLAEDDPLRPHIEEHEKRFPCPDMQELLEKGPGEQRGDLEESINQEIIFRQKVVTKYDLSLGEELFVFGRPLFHLMISVGGQVREVSNRLVLSWD
ncbi:MAG: YkgJ family cysteine cluster protein [Desulfobulbaceae bacterium]|nr:MAG: YkgJ family cysteine cluster protein [Desulfobulbaceae bacterium]